MKKLFCKGYVSPYFGLLVIMETEFIKGYLFNSLEKDNRYDVLIVSKLNNKEIVLVSGFNCSLKTASDFLQAKMELLGL